MDHKTLCLHQSPSGMYYCAKEKNHQEENHQEVVIIQWKNNKEAPIRIDNKCHCKDCDEANT